MDTKRNTDSPVQSVYIGIRVPEDLAENFQHVAAANERTVSAELRLLMRRHVDGADQPQEAAA